MPDLDECAAAALDLLVQRIPRIVTRDAPEPADAYALAVWFEWGRGDWYRWLPILVVMQPRRLDAGSRLGIDPRVAFWDPWGGPARRVGASVGGQLRDCGHHRRIVGRPERKAQARRACSSRSRTPGLRTRRWQSER